MKLKFILYISNGVYSHCSDSLGLPVQRSQDPITLLHLGLHSTSRLSNNRAKRLIHTAALALVESQGFPVLGATAAVMDLTTDLSRVGCHVSVGLKSALVRPSSLALDVLPLVLLSCPQAEDVVVEEAAVRALEFAATDEDAGHLLGVHTFRAVDEAALDSLMTLEKIADLSVTEVDTR